MPAQNQTIRIDQTKTYQIESDYQPSFILFSFLIVTSVQIGTHKFTDKLTSLHTNTEDNIGFDVGKCAAQLLFFFCPILFVCKLTSPYTNSQTRQN